MPCIACGRQTAGKEVIEFCRRVKYNESKSIPEGVEEWNII